MKRIKPWRWLGALFLCNVLAACGGGGGGESSDSPPASDTPFTFSVGATSAATATLAWHGGSADGTARYRIERRKGSEGAFTPVAEVLASDGLFLDGGLEGSSSYAYRVL